MSSNQQNNAQTKMSYEDVQAFIRDTDQVRGQLNYLAQQLELINHSINDLEGSRKTLDEIEKRKEGETILLPLGSQILIEATLHRKDKILFDIGSKIVQETDFETSRKKIQNRLDELNKTKSILSSNISQLRSELLSREDFLQKLIPIGKQ